MQNSEGPEGLIIGFVWDITYYQVFFVISAGLSGLIFGQ
jgi:tetrahydromethanopterin S-methyltransferase subunit F